MLKPTRCSPVVVEENTREGFAETGPAEFEVWLRGPIDVGASLELFRRSGDDLIDRWDGTTLVRTIRTEEGVVAYACSLKGTVEKPIFGVRVENASQSKEVKRAVRSAFVPAPPEFAELLCSDPVIARLDELYPGLRQARQFDLLAALVRCISAQQVSLRWATTTRRRLAEAFGEKHRVGGHEVYALSAERLAAADPAEIRSLQFTTRKAEYIVGIAEEVGDGSLNLPGLVDLSDEEIIRRLTSLRGVGLWTAEWILARTLGRSRVVAGDLGVRKAVGLAYLDEALPQEREVRRATSHWGRSAGVAQALLLHGLAEGVLGQHSV
jgi:DNA-3-methyladenine glycosylase II